MDKKCEQFIFRVGLCTILAFAAFGVVCTVYLAFQSFFG